MARIRTIKPDFWRDEDLSALPEATHLLAAALLNYADDEGYFNANPRLIQAECCPLREPSVSIHESLNLLSNAKWLRLGADESGKRYGQIRTFVKHQRINRPTPSKIKGLKISWEGDVSTHVQLSEPSPLERKGREGNKEGSSDSEKPSLRSGSSESGVETPEMTISFQPDEPEPKHQRPLDDDFPVMLDFLDRRSSKGEPPPATEESEAVEMLKDEDREFYRRGKEVLGKKAGGVLTEVRKRFGLERGMGVIEAAARVRGSPMEYVQGALRRERERDEAIEREYRLAEAGL